MTLTFPCRAIAAVALALLAALAASPHAPAATTVTNLPDELLPFGVAQGPDGRTWFVAADRRLYADFSTTEGAEDYRYRGVVGSIGAAGDVRVIVDAQGNDSQMNALPGDPVFGGDGAMYGAGASSGTVVRVTSAGEVQNIRAAPAGGGVSTMARGADGAIWFASSSGFGRFIGRLAPDLSVSVFTEGLTSSPNRLSAGPSGAVWLTDGRGKLLRTDSGGRTRLIRTPRASFSVLTKATDGRVWALNGASRFRGLWSIGRRGAIRTTCSFKATVNFRELVPAADGGAWMMAGPIDGDPSSYPIHVARSGKVTAYPDALPAGKSRVYDIAPGTGGSLLVAYRSGPEDRRQQLGHVAQVTPGSGGTTLCRPGLRRIPGSAGRR